MATLQEAIESNKTFSETDAINAPIYYTKVDRFNKKIIWDKETNVPISAVEVISLMNLTFTLGTNMTLYEKGSLFDGKWYGNKENVNQYIIDIKNYITNSEYDKGDTTMVIDTVAFLTELDNLSGIELI